MTTETTPADDSCQVERNYERRWLPGVKADVVRDAQARFDEMVRDAQARRLGLGDLGDSTSRAASKIATSIGTRRYIGVHAKKPRGSGLWAFTDETDMVVFTHVGRFSAARKAAQVWGSSYGIRHLEVGS